MHERTDRSLTKMTKVEIDEMRLWLKSAKTEPKQDFPVLTEKEFSCRLQDLEVCNCNVVVSSRGAADDQFVLVVFIKQRILG